LRSFTNLIYNPRTLQASAVEAVLWLNHLKPEKLGSTTFGSNPSSPYSPNYVIYLCATRKEIWTFGNTSGREWETAVSCLKWLISVLGTPDAELKVKTILTETFEKNIWKGSEESIPSSFDGTAIEEYALSESQPTFTSQTPDDLCWIKLLKSGYIGNHTELHFPYTPAAPQDEYIGRGLKVPFEFLAHIAGVESIVYVDDGPILCGIRTALTPIVQCEDGSVQWHFSSVDEDDSPFR
jgi:hypothetical protein